MFQVITREEALERIHSCIPEERRFSAAEPPKIYAEQDFVSAEHLPPFSRSVVDGYAVQAQDTYGSSEAIPAMLLYDGSISMGELPDKALLPGHCMAIPTGGFLPEGADAVSMVEYTEDPGDEFRYILKSLAVSENVNRQGDDCRKGDLLVAKGERITSKNLAILAAVGVRQVKEILKSYLALPASSQNEMRLGILSTGDELVEYDQNPKGGQIRNINTVMLAAAARELGVLPVIYPIVPDQLSALRETMQKAVSQCDAVCISGGTSVGEKDHVFQVLGEQGRVIFHGLAIKPGKPTMFAVIDRKPVFSLPGHPMAAYFIFRLLVKPALLRMTGRTLQEKTIDAVLSRNLSSNHGREELVPVKLQQGTAVPLRAGSGVVSVLARADGFIRIDRNREGLLQGTGVEVYSF